MSQANYTGVALEEFVMSRLRGRDYQFVDRNRFTAARILLQPIFTCQFHVGQSIYGMDQYCDFICFHPERWPDGLVIESKWQQESGSVDEKYPYLVLNIQNKYGYPTVLVLDGGGYKKGAEQWVRDQVGDGNFKRVFNMRQFAAWVNSGGL